MKKKIIIFLAAATVVILAVFDSLSTKYDTVSSPTKKVETNNTEE
ncbi:MAG: hypothetical protein ACI4TF_04570 [Oliverpabstia sp.]